MDELNTREKVESLDEPLAIKIPEVLSAHCCDEFCEKGLVSQRIGEIRFVETDDGVLRTIAPGEEHLRQIVVPEVLRSRLLNLALALAGK